MSTNENFFTKLFRSFFATNDPQAIKKKKLHKIAKAISKTRFSKWYKASSGHLSPDCAQFFFSVYRVVGPARTLLLSVNTNVLKNFCVEHYLSAEQKQMLSQLSESEILESQGKIPIEQIQENVKKRLTAFQKTFSSVQSEKMNQLYHHIKAFISLSTFDYYFLLKQFDYTLKELDFERTPDFKHITSVSVVENLHDFLEILLSFPFDADWHSVFTVIEKYKNVKPVNAGAWKKGVDELKTLYSSLVLENIIRHSKQNPDATFGRLNNVEDISNFYIRQVTETAEKTIYTMKRAMQNDKVASLVKSIFGSSFPSSGTKHYSVEGNKLFLSSSVSGYLYPQAMSYLKSFLIEYFKTEIRSISDLFLVRATWESGEKVQEYSDSYHELLALVDTIIQFDEALKEGEPFAMKLKASIARSNRDRNALNFVVRKVNEINGEAHRIIVTAAKLLISIANLFKQIIEDYDRPHRTLIQNWKEIEANSPKEPRNWLVHVYKKIHDFIVLEQLLIQKK